ncbi:MAG TPA: CHAD domain-containing protein, partial [Mycobacteriales bacterium]|nr:CHAD domain-containing protein [Mycobacteriales bacterium]
SAARHPGLTAAAGEPAAAALPPVVAKAWRRLRKGGRRLHADGPDAEWHEVRILAKRARYAGEAVAPALGKRAARLAAAAESVQDVIGEHQDAVVAASAVADVAAEHPGDLALVLVCGRLVERERAAVRAARAAFPKAWKKASAPAITAWLR